LAAALRIETYPTIILSEADGRILSTMTGRQQVREFGKHLQKALTQVKNQNTVRNGDEKPAKPGSFGRIDIVGRAEAFQQVKLVARVSGYVAKVNVDIGDRVKKGDLLVEVNAPELVSELRQKQAVVEQNRAGVQLAKASLGASQAARVASQALVQQAEANVKAANATLTYRKAQLERLRDLARVNVAAVPRQAVDEAEADTQAAKSALTASEANLAVAKANVEEGAAKRAKSAAELALAEARLDGAMADLQRVQILLDFARVRAPFDGVVIHRYVLPGDFVRGADGKVDSLVAIASTGVIRIVAQIAELDVARIHTGTPATITFAALPDQKFQGKVARVSGEINPKNGTLRVEIDLPNPNGRIVPGMFARVTLRPEKK
jgi:multidrug resistance efflux pump